MLKTGEALLIYWCTGAWRFLISDFFKKTRKQGFWQCKHQIWTPILRGGFRGGTPSYFCRKGAYAFIFSAKRRLNVCGHPGSVVFLLRKMLAPPSIENSWIRPWYFPCILHIFFFGKKKKKKIPVSNCLCSCMQLCTNLLSCQSWQFWYYWKGVCAIPIISVDDKFKYEIEDQMVGWGLWCYLGHFIFLLVLECKYLTKV